MFSRFWIHGTSEQVSASFFGLILCAGIAYLASSNAFSQTSSFQIARQQTLGSPPLTSEVLSSQTGARVLGAGQASEPQSVQGRHRRVMKTPHRELNQETIERQSDGFNYGSDKQPKTSNLKVDSDNTLFAPSAFQRFVEEFSGRLLPVFGLDYFDSVRTFTPIEDSPVPSDYQLGPGDELVITISGMLEANLRLLVDRHGQIQIPKYGPVNVQGVMASQVEDHIQKILSRYFKDFQLSVTLGRLRSIEVYLVGEAAKPGKWTMSSLSSLVNGLFSVGGPSVNGSMRSIKLRRAGRIVGEFDLYRFIRDGDTSQDQRLQSGDVIVIPTATTRVALLSHPDRSAIFELTDTEKTLGGLINLASLQQQLINPHRVLIERIDPNEMSAPRQILEKSLRQSDLSTPLQDGDIVRLFDIAPRFANAITLRGNVSTPLRHAYFQSMRLSDLIPDLNAIVDPRYYARKNRLVQFDQFGTQASRFGRDQAALRLGPRPEAMIDSVKDPDDRLDQPHLDYAVIERKSKLDPQARLIPFSLRKLLIDKEESADLLLEPGDIVTIFSQAEFTLPKQSIPRLVRIEGEVAKPGVYPVNEFDTPADVIKLAGGLTGNAYVYGTEFSRESVRIEQEKQLEIARRRIKERSSAAASEITQNTDPTQLALLKERLEASRLLSERVDSLRASGRLAMKLEFDAKLLPPISLEGGDRIYVPPIPASVNIFGAVNIESALIYRSGLRVSDYLALAGLRSDADPKEIFIIRADGSVRANPGRVDFFSLTAGVNGELVYPGDSIIVPEKLDKESSFTAFMRSARDFATVFGQLGIGASAIKILRQ